MSILKVTFILLPFAFLISCKGDESALLNEQFDSIEKLIEKRELIDTTVSKANVAWHLDHMLKVINNLYDTLQLSDTNNYEWSFNLTRSIVFTTGTIPRGRAKSSESVTPPKVILVNALEEQLKEAKSKMEKINQLHENASFNHPVFERLDRDQSIRFIEIHTNHHLKIVADIIEGT